MVVTLDALPKEDEWHTDWWASGFKNVSVAIKIKEDDLELGAFANDLIRNAQYIWRVRTAEITRRLRDHSTEAIALTEFVVFNPKDTFRLPKHDDSPFFDAKRGMVNGFKLHTGIYNGLFQLATAAVMDVVIHETNSVDGVSRSGFTLPVYTVSDLIHDYGVGKWRIETDRETTNTYKIVRTSVQEDE